MSTRESFLQKRFNDVKNFPYGFSRSGDFSFAEAQLLEKYGHLCQALLNGEVSDLTEEDKHFILAVKGETAPNAQIEYTWLKYLKVTKRDHVVLRPKNNMASDISRTADMF